MNKFKILDIIGNRNTAQLVIHVEDTNDSSPTFSQIQYEAYISENSLR